MTNTTLNVLIVDDDKLNIKLISNLIQTYCPNLHVVGKAESVDTALELIATKSPDLIFLDIELRHQNAVEILKTIPVSQNIQVILITAHQKYALEMYKYSVADYLLKPVNLSAFIEAVNKVILIYERNYRKGETGVQNPGERTNSASPIEYKHISIPHKEHIELIPVEEVLHLEAHGNYTSIVTVKNVKRLSSRLLKEYESQLPSELFIRVHNSHIVNVGGIIKIIRSRTGSLVLMNNTEIPISASRKADVFSRLMYKGSL